MKKLSKKTKAIIVGASTLCIISISGILAYFTDTETVTNHVTMGIVDIDLKEYTLDEHKEKVEWTDMEDVTPGQTISKIPEISCVEGAVDCYVRAKVTLTCDDEELQKDEKMLTQKNLNIDQQKWYYCNEDGYFYYKQILSAGQDPVQLFTEVSIPSNLDNKWAQKKLDIVVKVDAIQADNFNPSFETGTEKPWPDITEQDIQECIYSDHSKH